MLEGLLLHHVYDRTKTQYLVSGFREGFHLRMSSSVSSLAKNITKNKSSTTSNHKSARANPKAVEDKLATELKVHRMIGPFTLPVFQDYIISLLGIRERKTPGKFCLIHNLSAPHGGSSVNYSIPKEEATVSYDTVDSAVKLIQSIGQSAVMAKTDIQHSYKLIPIHPQDIPALGIRWFNTWL